MNLLQRNKKLWILAVGFTGLVYSHVISTVIATGIGAIILLCYMFRWKNFKKKMIQLLGTVIGVMLLTMAYWGPMFEQFLVQTYRVSQPWTHVWNNVPSFGRMMMENGMGTVLVISVIVLIISILCMENRISGKLLLWLMLGIGLFVIMLWSRFWNGIGKLLDFIQFPSRLKDSIVVCLTFAICLGVVELGVSEKWRKLLSGIILAASICFGLTAIEDYFGNTEDFGYATIYEEIAGLGAGEEWLPVETTREVLVTPLIAFNQKGEQYKGTKEGNDYYFELGEEDKVYMMPLVWYKG